MVFKKQQLSKHPMLLISPLSLLVFKHFVWVKGLGFSTTLCFHFRQAESLCSTICQLSFSCTNLSVSNTPWRNPFGVVSYCYGCLEQQYTRFMLDFTYSSFPITMQLRCHPWNNKGDLDLILGIINCTFIFSLSIKKILQHLSQISTWQKTSGYIFNVLLSASVCSYL